jgi:DNA-binding transcriptional ArsR family regulator
MGTWVVPADLLAVSRFVISPFAETVAGLILLSTPEPLGVPWQRTFRARHREAYLEMLAADETRRLIGNYLWRPWRGPVPGWIADFLCLPPGTGGTFEDELDQLSEWDDDRIRAAIGEFTGGPLPAGLARAGLRDAVAAIVRWMWTTTLVSEWPRRRRVLEADIVSRTSRLSSLGWAGVLGTLGPNTRWLGDGRLQINAYDRPSRDLSGARELSFVPVHGYRGWSALELPHWFAIVYPVTGALASVGPAAGPDLGRLIGGNRARVLALLDEPHSTTQLAALTGLPIGAVGNHLRVLLDAGAVLRRRAGREVLYWRTSLGDSLVAAGRLGERGMGTLQTGFTGSKDLYHP